jgi:phage terminase large subunit-like protein
VTDWNPSLRRLTFRTGAVATLFSGASPEQLRGPEHHLAWCDELAKWEKPRETWDMLQFGLRLGDWPRALVTTTPRPGPVLTAIIAEPDTLRTGGPTTANPHTAAAWREATKRLYSGTRLGRQELDGELLPDVPGALWTVELLEKCRVDRATGAILDCRGQSSPVLAGSLEPTPSVRPERSAERVVEGRLAPDSEERPSTTLGTNEAGGQSFPDQSTTLIRVIIAVDPPAGDGTCGIIACARDEAGTAHILADHSVTARSPEGWARAVADAVWVWTNPVIASPAGARQPSPAQEKEAGLPRSARNDDGEAAPAPVIASPAGARQPSLAHEEEAGLPRSARNDDGEAAPAAFIASPGGARQPSPSLIPMVVAEQNQGGKMVKSVLHTADPKLRVKLVTATVGKAERAAPVAMLFEAGRVVLHGRFPELEAEMLGMIAGGDYEGPGNSPDRADAMVWGLTELMLTPERAPPSVRGF